VSLIRVSLFLITFCISIGSARADFSSSSSGGSKSSSFPGSSKKQCCFCVHPNKGEKDFDLFGAICEACLPQKLANCDVKKSLEASQFTPEMLKTFNCDSPVQWINLQHGPNLGYVMSQVEVCRSAYPSCSISVNDLSCSTYGDEARAKKAMEVIQDTLGGKGQVSICGSASVTSIGGCDSIRASKRYVISPRKVVEEVGPCIGFGRTCSSLGKEYECKDTLGRVFKQKCCAIGSGFWGVWSGPGQACVGRGCDESSCPHRESCSGDVLSTQGCATFKDTGSSFCFKDTVDCGAQGQTCAQNSQTNANCVARKPSPSPSAETRG